MKSAAESRSPDADGSAIICGGVHKEGRGMFGSITFRFFELIGSANGDYYLKYWDTEQKARLISSMNLRGAKHSATKKKRDKFLYSLRIDMDARLPGNSYSKIVLLFNDEHEHDRWNDSLAAILSEDRVFSRGAGASDAAADAAPTESDSKAWQHWQQEHVRTAKTGGGAGLSGSLSARGRAGNGRVRSKSGGSATDFLMDSPRRSRFLVNLDEAFSKTNFVPVITCSDDVPRMHFLADLPALGSVAAGAITGLFSRKLELCCLQFDFTKHEDPDSAFEQCRRKKREALIEIYKYLEAVSPQSPLPLKLLQQLLVMIQCNILRPLPAIAPDQYLVEADGDELPCEIAWTHVGVAYDILLLCSQPGCFSKQRHRPHALQHIIEAFDPIVIEAIVHLCQSSDYQERDKLQRVLHNLRVAQSLLNPKTPPTRPAPPPSAPSTRDIILMYAKFLGLRPSIKQAMCTFLQQRAQVAAALDCHPNTRSRLSEFGTGEMLTILDSVANGFVLPLKEEHVLFFLNTLLPLYRSLTRFSAPLVCICRTFMMKEAVLSHAVVKYLLRYWPISSPEKVLVFVSTLKDAVVVLTTTEPMQPACLKELMTRLRACMGSQSRDILQAGLELWQQASFIDLVKKNMAHEYIFCLFGDLPEVFAQHWCQDAQPFFDRAIQELDSLGMVTSQQVPLSVSQELKTARAIKWRMLEGRQY